MTAPEIVPRRSRVRPAYVIQGGAHPAHASSRQASRAARARSRRAAIGRTRRWSLIAGALLALLAGIPPARAEGDAGASGHAASALPAGLKPTVKTTLTPHAIAVGEIAKLTIDVDAPSALGVSLPEQSFGGLELSDRRLRAEPHGERTRTLYELDLIAFEPGSVEVPALTLRLVGPNGELDEAKTEPQALTVRSLIANEPNAAPKPATKPVRVMQDDYTLAWIGVGLLGVALTALATLYVSRWLRNRPKPALPPPPPRPAWELALERLDSLARDKDELFAAGRAEEFVDGVSDAVREYLGRRYGFDGLERTTAELVTTLDQLAPPKLSLPGVRLLLEQCDLVKFARAVPDPGECQDLWNGALGLVRATTPTVSEAPPLDAHAAHERALPAVRASARERAGLEARPAARTHSDEGAHEGGPDRKREARP